ncbi:secondary thiamine-phosphate synthase enzyme YjbQ [Candidatus Bipolaricaulota bacterium]|nr:secondary thiamine-phosphate synthase enzyme YjbQ [Candidatus Bipolaricaulota bacterium]MBS3814407.1 secondary thiamine-phosphate synthase enzyme YjbQ [Candidatus Bipolaricaulota bacterium]MBS3825535.1 secondary thiamine-phosphate synthase enzyme YjbQ [Candidatus Bipolaricaulota bacterium]
MAVETKKIYVRIGSDSQMAEITQDVQRAVKESHLTEGSANLFIPGATGSISTVEYEPGLEEDVPDALERLAPPNIHYKHHETWNDDNGRSHVRATIMGPGMVVPFVDGELQLGRWQNIIAINHDTRKRNREVIVQLIGE